MTIHKTLQTASLRACAIALACSLAFPALNALAATDQVLSTGLRQLVVAYETGDARLASQLQVHVKTPAGDPLVHVKLEDGASAAEVLPRLRAAGFRLTAASTLDASRLEGFLPLRQARAAGAVAGVRSLRAVLQPMRNAGAVQSQGVALMKADRAQARGADGTGIRVGVLSDSYDGCGSACRTNAAGDIASGDLPAAGVTVLEDLPVGAGGEDEGRGMLQLVHDVAPGAQLGFATAQLGELEFANNILRLRSQFKADVIVDDVTYYDEPMFSDGIVAQAVDAVAKDGAAYFSSAGNNGQEAYEAYYTPIPFDVARRLAARGVTNLKLDQIPAAIRPKSLHVFRGTPEDPVPALTQQFSTFTDNRISFQWDEPFYVGKVKTDFNIYVFDADGNWMDPASPDFPGFYTTDDNTQTDAAFEFVRLLPVAGQIKGGANVTDYQIVIGKVNDGPARRIKYVAVNGLGVSQRQGAPSVFGHAAAKGAQAVAANFYAIPQVPEDFSSPGPVTILYATDGTPLPRPDYRFVPQITAPDGAETTFFGLSDPEGNGIPNFFGTSAASPHAAAVGALVLQAAGGSGSLTPQRLYRLIQATATPIPVPNDRSWSFGQAGPVQFSAQGDFARWDQYFGLALQDFAGRRGAVKSVTLDLADTGLTWSTNLARFSVGNSTGVKASDITPSGTPDGKSFTLSFAPGSFKAGETFRFGMSAFSPLQGSAQLSPDRFRGMRIQAVLESGQTYRTEVVAAPKLPVNRFTGAGLVNAEAAVREAQNRAAF